MNDYHISNMNLKSRIISLEKTIEFYRSSKKYEELRHFYDLRIKEKDVQISNLKKEMEQDSSHYKKAIREWMKANEEICEDCTGQLSSKDKEISQIQERLNKAYQELNILYEQVSSSKATIDSLQKQLDKEQGENAKLNAQVNKNYENSSIPSSADPFREKIENGRKPSEKLKQVMISASKEQKMFFARDHKGHKGIEESPVAHSTNILLHDHEIAFYKYGTNHQECLVHVLRYLKGSIENEKNLSWNKRMFETVHKIMHYVNNQDVLDKKEIQAIIKEYDINLEIAELNYKEHPPSKYYREGYNLYKRMKVFRDNHILFLVKEGIPYDNNLSERLARVIKRKVKQMMTFRSFDSFADTCTSLGVLETIRLESGNLLKKSRTNF